MNWDFNVTNKRKPATKVTEKAYSEFFRPRPVCVISSDTDESVMAGISDPFERQDELRRRNLFKRPPIWCSDGNHTPDEIYTDDNLDYEQVITSLSPKRPIIITLTYIYI